MSIEELQANADVKCPQAPVLSTVMRSIREDGGIDYTYLLYGDIIGLAKYTNLLHVLFTANPQDRIYLRMDTSGGSVFTAITISNAITQCAGKVILVADGKVISSGIFIASVCSHFYISDTSTWMAHSSSHCGMGKSYAVVEEGKAILGYVTSLVNRLRDVGILTEEEHARVCSKHDVFLLGKTIKERLADKLEDAIYV